jgi:hypothetical protein
MRALINAYIIHVTLGVLVFLKGWHTFDKKKWAADEFRSVNGQIQWMLDQQLRKSGRLKSE